MKKKKRTELLAAPIIIDGRGEMSSEMNALNGQLTYRMGEGGEHWRAYKDSADTAAAL